MEAYSLLSDFYVYFLRFIFTVNIGFILQMLINGFFIGIKYFCLLIITTKDKKNHNSIIVETKTSRVLN